MTKYINNFKKYRFLLRELVKKGIKLKYRRSYLGILWTLLEPILQTCVLAIVFGNFFGRNDKTFPVYILTGRLLYSFFSAGTRAAMKSIRAHSGMIKKVYVPKYIYPLSSVMFNFVIFLISLIVLLGAMFIFGIYPTIWLTTIVVPIILLFMFTLGVGLILSTMAVFFRDLEYLWEVALTLIMYTCAIFYKVDSFKETATYWVFKINPLYAIIKCFREAVYGENMFATPAWVIMPFAASIVTIVIGTVMFKKNQDKFILHI